MKMQGYNVSYPITLNQEGELIDGGHRIEAAMIAGIIEIPYVVKTDDAPDARHAIRCNEDGADTKRYDVFDYAHHCYIRAKQGWTGQMIADEIGWDSRSKVTQYKAIREGLCPEAWCLARDGFTSNGEFVNSNESGLVNPNFTIVNTEWNESHFRMLLRYLKYNPDAPDPITAGEQVRAIPIILGQFAWALIIHPQSALNPRWNGRG